jgi:toxin CptA
MHGAPSVTYPVGRSRFAGLLAAVVCALPAVVLAAWGLAADALNWRHAVGAGCWVVAACACILQWRRAPAGTLSWDGGAWHWNGVAIPAPRAAVDLQRWMLLEAGKGGPGWLAVDQDAAPSHWDALRRALYSPASTATPQAESPPVQST